MNKISKLHGDSEDNTFDFIISNLKNKITDWDYFVNWEKVLSNVNKYRCEINLLNSLIGVDDVHNEAISLFKKYPEVIKVIPTLLAIRDNSLEILIDSENFVYECFDFNKENLTKDDIKNFATFIEKTGFSKLLKQKQIKNLQDYVTGVEVGINTHSRKNRGGKKMEDIVETFVKRVCGKNNLKYITQATKTEIKSKWKIDIKTDKSDRKIDFAINKNNKFYFIETNFYGGGGSKIKSTAGEYTKLNEFWNEQGIEFIWITDGNGLRSAILPLREYFDKSDFLLNLEMLKNGYLEKIILE